MGRTAWMNGHSGHRVHVWLGDVFNRDRDVEIPCANRLIIRSGYEPPILVHECDSVHRPQVLIILLRDLACPYVVLESETAINHTYREGNVGETPHLHNLLVRHPRQENILLVVVGMEPNHIRNLSVAKAAEALSGLCIPEFHLSVIPTRQKLAAVVRKRKVFDSFYVSMKGSQAVSVSVNVPQLKRSSRVLEC